MNKKEIIEYFAQFENEIHETEKGIFGVSNLVRIKEFLDQIETTGTFVDLGSGDGRVAILAAEYFDTVIGIEYEEDLIEKSELHAKQTNSDVTFLAQDYENYDYSKVDVLFSYADHEFSKKFVEKLIKEFTGVIYIYEGVYFPEGAKKGKTIWADQTPIMTYTFNKDFAPRVREQKVLKGKGATGHSRFMLDKKKR